MDSLLGLAVVNSQIFALEEWIEDYKDQPFEYQYSNLSLVINSRQLLKQLKTFRNDLIQRQKNRMVF
jgi:hypothetical protein